MKKYFGLNIPILVAIFSLINLNSISIAGLFDRPDFFEKGYEQFEEEVRRFQQRQNVSEPILDLNQIPWSRVLIKEAGFTVKMPPGIITNEVKLVDAPKGAIQFNIMATHPSSSRYVIAYSEEVAPGRFTNTKEILKRTQETITKNNVGLLNVSDRDFTFKNYPGRQFKLRNETETITFRLLLVEQRLYVLAVNQQNDAISIRSVNKFFNSFDLID